MNYGTLEILALILIAIAVIKLIVFVVNPQWWYAFIGKIYKFPLFTSLTSFVLAMVVLYYLIQSGVTIVEILAVSLFIALLIAIGFAKYSDRLISWIKGQDIVFVLKEVWLYTLVWLLLLAWGAGEILFS